MTQLPEHLNSMERAVTQTGPTTQKACFDSSSVTVGGYVKDAVFKVDFWFWFSCMFPVP